MRLLLPLRVKAIALLWAGLATSAAGDQLGMVALTWIAIGTLGANAGYLTAAQAGMTLLAALLIGRWTDGRNERRLMIAADITRALVLLLVVALWYRRHRTSPAELTLLVVTLAAGQAAFRPAVQAIMPALAPSAEMLPATNALLDGTDRLARIAGPALIALVATWLPTIHFLTLDALSFLASAAALLAIGARPTRSIRAAKPMGAVILQGFRALRRHRLLGYLLGTAGINNGTWYAAFYLGVPLLLSRHATHGIKAFGIVIACYGLTNLAGNLVVGNRKPTAAPARLICGGNVLTGAGIALIGVGSLLPGAPLWAICAGSALAGGGGPMNDIPRAALMQTTLPAPDLAAAFRAWIVSANAGILLAMAAAPALFARTGPAAGVALCGLVMIAGGLWGLLRHAQAKPLGRAPATH